MAYRNHSTGGNTTATTMVIAYPTGFQPGDICVLHIYTETTGLTIAFDKGSWTKVTTASGINSGTIPSYEVQEFWSRIAAESGNLTVSWGGGSVFNVGIMEADSGRLTSGSPLDGTSTYNEADPTATTAWLATSVTTAFDNSAMVIYGASVEATTWGALTAGLTNRVEIGNSMLATGTAGAAGATGNKTSTLTVSAHWTAGFMTLRIALLGGVGFIGSSRPFPYKPGSPGKLGRGF